MLEPHEPTPDRRWIFAALGLLVAGVLLIPHEDIWSGTAMYHFNRTLGSWLSDFVNLGNQFPKKEGFVIAGLVMAAFYGWRSGILWRFVLGLGLTGAINSVGKIFFSRQRPRFDRRDGYVRELPPEETGRWFAWEDSLLARGGFNPDAAFFSFPSGHSAVAGFIAMYLTYHFPRAWFVWWGLATMTVFHRFDRTAHYLSDCLVGLAVGMLICHLVLPQSAIPRWCGRMLTRTRAKFGPVRADGPTA